MDFFVIGHLGSIARVATVITQGLMRPISAHVGCAPYTIIAMPAPYFVIICHTYIRFNVRLISLWSSNMHCSSENGENSCSVAETHSIRLTSKCLITYSEDRQP